MNEEVAKLKSGQTGGSVGGVDARIKRDQVSYFSIPSSCRFLQYKHFNDALIFRFLIDVFWIGKVLPMTWN